MSNSSKVILITGATAGIGKAGALELGRRGWKVFVHARSVARGNPVLDELKKNAPNAEFVLVTGDMASLKEVKALADQVRSQTEKLDVLWNNAGLILDERKVSADGWELTMAINHLAPFVLTRELLPLIESVRGRIITTSSFGNNFGAFNWDDWMDEKSKYSSMKIYGKSKLANILFTRELAHRVAAKGITAYCYHPGFVRTDFGKQRDAAEQKSFMPDWLRPLIMIDAEAGADTGVFLADDPSVTKSNGRYWSQRKVRWTKSFDNDSNAAKLWELSEKATS
jgi:NAD(P)-dependent dehydrogenase (short-subunit alcohol dehydrogenase family)